QPPAAARLHRAARPHPGLDQPQRLAARPVPGLVRGAAAPLPAGPGAAPGAASGGSAPSQRTDLLAGHRAPPARQRAHTPDQGGLAGTPQGAASGRMKRGLWLLRSEEHTSELQSRENLVCRLLLEKKKKSTTT